MNSLKYIFSNSCRRFPSKRLHRNAYWWRNVDLHAHIFSSWCSQAWVVFSSSGTGSCVIMVVRYFCVLLTVVHVSLYDVYAVFSSLLKYQMFLWRHKSHLIQTVKQRTCYASRNYEMIVKNKDFRWHYHQYNGSIWKRQSPKNMCSNGPIFKVSWILLFMNVRAPKA